MHENAEQEWMNERQSVREREKEINIISEEKKEITKQLSFDLNAMQIQNMCDIVSFLLMMMMMMMDEN